MAERRGLRVATLNVVGAGADDDAVLMMATAIRFDVLSSSQRAVLCSDIYSDVTVHKILLLSSYNRIFVQNYPEKNNYLVGDETKL